MSTDIDFIFFKLLPVILFLLLVALFIRLSAKKKGKKHLYIAGVLLAIYSALCWIHLSYSKQDSFTLTKVDVQRMDIDIPESKGKILYQISTLCEVNIIEWGYETDCTMFTENGNTEHLTDIIVQDSARNRISTEIFTPSQDLYICEASKISKLRDNYIWLSNERSNWEDEKFNLQAGSPTSINSNKIIFCVKEGSPTPAFFTLRFKERDMVVKINNTPVKYKVIDTKRIDAITQ